MSEEENDDSPLKAADAMPNKDVGAVRLEQPLIGIAADMPNTLPESPRMTPSVDQELKKAPPAAF